MIVSYARTLVILSLGSAVVAACGSDQAPAADDDGGAQGGNDETGGGGGAGGGMGGAGIGGEGGEIEPAPTWNGFAQQFFVDYCTVCHSQTGQATADFNELDVVRLRLNAIRCGTAPELLPNCEGEHPPGWFPIGNGPKPSEAERWLMVDWCEAGGPE